MLAAMTLLDPGDDVVLARHTSSTTRWRFAPSGATPIEAPLQASAGFSARWADIAGRITPERARSCSARRAIRRERSSAGTSSQRIVRELADRGFSCCRDETYRHFVYDGSACERRVSGGLAPHRRRRRHLLEVVRHDRLARGIPPRRSRRLQPGDQDSGRDDHLRSGDFPDCRGGRGARQLELRALVPRRVASATNGPREKASRAIPRLEWSPTPAGFSPSCAWMAASIRSVGRRHPRSCSRGDDPRRDVRPGVARGF